MKRVLLLLTLVSLVFVSFSEAQKKRPPQPPIKKIIVVPPSLPSASRESANTALVIDERLSVLRERPSLYAKPIQRMRRGRLVAISGSQEADGVTFYRVNLPPPVNYGWVQREAVIVKTKSGSDERLARLIQGSEGFDQFERAMLFLDNFPNSTFRPAMLLLLGDLAEENAQKLSLEATRRLDKSEMAASGAPVQSFYLNYNGLDRFRKLGISFVFNLNTKTFHYDGASWKDILEKFPTSNEAVEAQKKLDALKQKMEAVK